MWSNNPKGKKGQGISIGIVSDRGNVRERNEDTVWAVSDGNEAVCMVADGVGGCQGGGFASAAAARAVERYWKKPQGLSGLRRIFDEAHAEIREFINETKEKAGTTLSVLYCIGGEFSIAHAGDSRIYRLSRKNASRVELLTVDDTWVAQKMREGEITAEEAAVHPKRHTLTNCLGGVNDCRVLEMGGRIAPYDVFLLCSDGLYNYVDGDELRRKLRRRSGPQETADELLRLALSRGGRDNISVVVVKFH